MMDKIDFGEVKVPTKWDEVTLLQFQRINDYYSDKERTFNVIDVIDIFVDKDKDFIMSLPAEFLDILLAKLKFIEEEEPKVEEPTNKIVIDGEEYMINFMEKLKTGEFVSVDTITKSNKNDYASVLAVLCRKEGEIYNSKFEAEQFEDRKKLFEKQPITKILPIIAFFLNLYILSATPSQLHSKVEEELNHIRQSIKTSTEIGAFKKRSLNSQVKKLQKLLRSSKNT